jgi:uncharacterized protein
MEEKVVYYEQPGGAENTETTLKLALERAKARGIKKIVLASTRGDTARKAAALWTKSGIKIIVIPHQFGFAGMTFPPELIKELENQGHTVHFGTMLFHTDRFYGVDTPTIMANLLRTFCQGMKVCVEIILMAADAGLVDIGEQIVVVSGSGRGADTAVVAIASTSTHLADLHITEFICKPLQTKQGPPPPPPGQMPPPPGQLKQMPPMWKKPD